MPEIKDPGESNLPVAGDFGLFTDRREIIRAFATYVNGPPQNTIFFIHGDGGNGKSLLLAYLKRHFCKRLDAVEWARIRTLNDSEFQKALSSAKETVPVALVDFASLNRKDARDPFNALTLMRQQLKGHGVHFPHFDFGCMLYLAKLGELTTDRIRDMFPAEEADVLTGLVDAVMNWKYLALINLLFKLGGKHLGRDIILRVRRRRLSKREWSRLQELDELQLLEELPKLFAHDLNSSLDASGIGRVILLFDGYDAFWGLEERSLPEERRHDFDRWLRCLLQHLSRDRGVVVTVTGRNKPSWSLAFDDWKISPDELDLHEIEGLSFADARDFLDRAQVNDPTLRNALLEYAQLSPGSVHPLFLQLCAEVVRRAKADGVNLRPTDFQQSVALADKRRQLIERLFHYLRNSELVDAAQALGACRSFDYLVYKELGDQLGFVTSRSYFRELTALPFVRQIEQADKMHFQFHQLLRRVLSDAYGEYTRLAHGVLQSYYLRAGADGIVDAIYHQNWLDWRAGVTTWVETMQPAIENANFPMCRRLISLVPDLQVDDDYARAQVLRCEAAYRKAIGAYSDSIAVGAAALALLDAVVASAPSNVRALSEKAHTLLIIGEAYAELTDYALGLDSYKSAVSSCDMALSYSPSDAEVHNNRAAALISMAEMEAERAKYTSAMEHYETAIQELREVLAVTPESREAPVNCGYALSSLGELEKDLSEHEAAILHFEGAISTYDKAIRIGKDLTALNNKAYALAEMAECYRRMQNFAKAIEHARDAIALYDEILTQAPEDHTVYSNKSRALTMLGECLGAAHQQDFAAKAIMEAISTAEQALRFAPEDIWAHNTRALALLTSGHLAEGPNREGAIELYENSLKECTKAIGFGKDEIEARFFRALALIGLSHLSETDAPKYLHRALAALDEMLARAPDDVDGGYERGKLLCDLARHDLTAPDGWTRAERRLKDASIEYARVRKLAPKDPRLSAAQEVVRGLRAELDLHVQSAVRS